MQIDLLNKNYRYSALKNTLTNKALLNQADSGYSYFKNFENFKRINFKGLDFKELQTVGDFNSSLLQNWFQLGGYFDENGKFIQFQPDSVQIECAKNIFQGNSLVYSAPTGSGKTAVANYAITKCLKEGRDVIYTSPLKALANDKYREFSKIYGADNVAILTGDIKYNTQAPIKIMTTEVYNNQVSTNADYSSLGAVIFDEAHYIADDDRGNVWENSIMNTPNDVQIVCLSATIGNVDKLTNWMQSLNPTKKAVSVELTPENRYVPLNYYIYSASNEEKFQPVQKGTVDIAHLTYDKLTDRQIRAMKLLAPDKVPSDTALNLITDLTLEDDDEPLIFQKDEFSEILRIIHPELSKADSRAISALLEDVNKKEANKIQLDWVKPDYPQLVYDLRQEQMLPALIFNLSIKGCEGICADLERNNVDLTTDAEKEQIKEILDEYKAKGIYLGNNYNPKMLLSGYFYHHSGLLPQYRKLIEELFSKKLLKAVVATSTLSAGINMPARTTVITGANYMKYDPETDEIKPQPISASEFHQMAGRAGRRGIDEAGNVVLYNLKNKKQDENGLTELDLAYQLLDSSSDNLRSVFKPQFQMLANYFDSHETTDELNKFIKSSFKMYLSKNPDKDFKSFETKFKRAQDALFKQGFLTKDNKGLISTTPKGKILKMSQGLNPLMLAGMVYDEQLKDLTVAQLVQTIAYITASDEQEEEKGSFDLIFDKLKANLSNDPNAQNLLADFKTASLRYSAYESRILKTLRESRLKPDEIKVSNTFSGYIAYLWSYLNDINGLDSVSNFSKLTRKIKPSNVQNPSVDEYNRQASEGHIYRILSGIISTLKQIDKICDYALLHPELYPNIDYYKNLKETAQLALTLVNSKPLEDELSL